MMKFSIPDWLHIPHREDRLFSIVYLLTVLITLSFYILLDEGYETPKYAALLILGGIGVLMLLKRKHLVVHAYLLGFLLIYLLLNVISTIFSLDPNISIFGLGWRYTGSLFFLAGFVSLIIMLWNSIKDSEDKKLALLRLVTFCGMAISVFAIFQSYGIGFYAGLTEVVRQPIPSFMGNPNFYAMYLIAVVPAAIIQLVSATRRLTIYFGAGTLIATVWAIILSGSRGAILGTFITLLTFAFVAFIRKYYKLYIWLALGVTALLLIFGATLFSTIRSDSIGNVTASDYTTSSRFVLWNNTLTIISGNPLLGTGPGNFFIMYQRLSNSELASLDRFDDAHNLFLHIAATTGLPAAAIFLLTMLYCSWLLWVATKDRLPSAIWGFTVMPGLMFAVSFNPVSIANWFLIGVLIAFAGTYQSSRVSFHKVCKVFIGLVALAIIAFGISFLLGQVYSIQGYLAYQNADFEKAEKYIRTSMKINPFNNNMELFLLSSQINLNRDEEQIDKDIQAMINKHPNVGRSYENAAYLYYRLYLSTENEKYKNSVVDEINSALQLEPDSVKITGSAAYLYFRIGQEEESFDVLRRNLSFANGPKNEFYWFLMAKIYQNQGNRQGMLRAVQKANLIKPGLPNIRALIGAIRTVPDVKSLVTPFYFPEIEI